MVVLRQAQEAQVAVSLASLVSPAEAISQAEHSQEEHLPSLLVGQEADSAVAVPVDSHLQIPIRYSSKLI